MKKIVIDNNRPERSEKVESDRYQPDIKEKYWQDYWRQKDIYRFDPDSEKELFTIDTPPPTISGKLHLGHVFSYTQTETIARAMKFMGYNVRYPFCLDDNGLPTERLVEKEKRVSGRNMSLEDFIARCHEVVQEFTPKYIGLFEKLGFSMDMDLIYSTIAEKSQRLSQSTFIDFLKRGLIYQEYSPALYCPECHTSVAQAEMEDKKLNSVFYDIVFKNEKDENIVIATTRPELLPACVGVFVHPGDKRHINLIGQTLTTPLDDKVKVLADEKVIPEKGTGIVMCCSYGDETDVDWIKRYKLREKVIISPEGTIVNVTSIPEINGKKVSEARRLLVDQLRFQGMILDENNIEHEVGVHERCSTPIEILAVPQWFIKLLDHKKELLEAGGKIKWYPKSIKKRYEDWVSNLKWDWCISRGRYFGIPVPVFHCQDCQGFILPDTDELPIDPRSDKKERSCPHCQSARLIPEQNVLDTWFTSSQTPDINNDHPCNGRWDKKMIPMNLRTQAHDIIRTWATYSILMSLLKHEEIPWKEIMISGHILVKKGEKISKRTGGGIYDPEQLIITNSADAIRYAMCGATLGLDGYFDEKEVKNGKRLATKLWNAGKMVIGNLGDYQPRELEISEMEATDRWILLRLTETQEEMEKAFKVFEFAKARKVFENFFWNDFCDNYLEMVKGRIYGNDESLGKLSAKQTLYQTYFGVLQLAAPFVPHITEEMYHASVILNTEGNRRIVSQTEGGYYQIRKGLSSIHSSQWGKVIEKQADDDQLMAGGQLALEIISKVRQQKSEKKLGLGQPINSLIIRITNQEKVDLIKPFLGDLQNIAKAGSIEIVDLDTSFQEAVAEMVIEL